MHIVNLNHFKFTSVQPKRTKTRIRFQKFPIGYRFKTRVQLSGSGLKPGFNFRVRVSGSGSKNFQTGFGFGLRKPGSGFEPEPETR